MWYRTALSLIVLIIAFTPFLLALKPLREKQMDRIMDGINGAVVHDPSVDYMERNDGVKEALVSDVDRVVEKIGRLPADQQELESLRGNRMPVIIDKGREVSILYRRVSPTRYYLIYTLFDTDDWIYDSAKKELGWFQHWD